MRSEKMIKRLSKENPGLLILYFVIATVIIANIFVAGYWFGRTRQLSEAARRVSIGAVASPTR